MVQGSSILVREELCTCQCALPVTFHLLCRLTGHTVVGTDLGPTFTMNMLATGPGVSQALFSPVQMHRGQDPRLHISHISTDWVLRSQLRSWPSLVPLPPCMCPRSPQLLKPDPLSCGSWGPIVRSDVPPALNVLGSWWRCQLAVCAAGARFRLFLLSHGGPQGSAMVSSPPLYVSNPANTAPGAAGVWGG